MYFTLRQERAPFLVYGSFMYKYQGEEGGGEVTQSYSVTGEGWCKKKSWKKRNKRNRWYYFLSPTWSWLSFNLATSSSACKHMNKFEHRKVHNFCMLRWDPY